MKESTMKCKSTWLCVLAMLIFTACSSDNSKADTDASTPPSQNTDTAEAAETRLADNFPDDLDFNDQQVRILNYENYIRTEDGNDIVSAAAYRAALAVQERLNVTYSIDIYPATDIGELVRQSILAASDDYEIVTSHISDKYLQGILIGYIQDIKVDSSNMTKTAYLVPAVDFERLDEVLIVTELKEAYDFK